ncbi:MAG: CoA-binding protein [Elusimicrobia bacterium]|nr:CoA-binding protein [Elusimicrobiota bacterium]
MYVIAVVGCSPKPERPSNQVASYLIDVGYRVIPVNPACGEILGEKCYPSLLDIPEPVDVVDVFRKREHAQEVVRQAVRIKAKGVWLQDGVDTPEAVELARAGGLKVVANDCIMRQHLSRFGR